MRFFVVLLVLGLNFVGMGACRAVAVWSDQLAVDAKGRSFTLDGVYDLVQVFGPSGELIKKWGISNDPDAITVDASGVVYAWTFEAIRRFDSNGKSLGAAKLKMDRDFFPHDVCLDGAGRLLAVDSYRCKVRVYDRSGNVVAAWGKRGSGQGEFDSPSGIAVDALGNVFVADSDNYRIQRFDSSGKFLSEWGVWGRADGEFMTPLDIAVTPEGNVAVVDPEAKRVQVFDSSGKLLSVWRRDGRRDGQLSTPFRIAFDGKGFCYLLNSYGEDTESGRVEKFDAAGKAVRGWFYGKFAKEAEEDGKVKAPANYAVFIQNAMNSRVNMVMDLAVGSDGCFYTTSLWDHAVRKYDSKGKFLLRWGWEGTPDDKGGFEDGPVGVTLARDGSLLVGEAMRYRIQRFDQAGRLLAVLDSDSEESLIDPVMAASDAAGNVYGLDDDVVVVWDSKGKLLRTWSYENEEQGEFGIAPGFGVDALGNVFISDPGGSGVRKFDPNGKVLAKWGSEGTEPGQFQGAADLAVDANGDVYVLDIMNYRVQKFDSSGKYLFHWGSEGEKPGQFGFPAQIAVGPNGDVFTMDLYSDMVQRFDSSGKFLGAIKLSTP